MSYQEDALKTESYNLEAIRGRLVEEDTIRLLHAGIGLATEAGEFLDMLKKHLFYGKPLDGVNLMEECGDICWYLAIALDALGTDFETIQTANIAKLKARYPEKFTEHHANERQLEIERAVLEAKLELSGGLL